MIWTICRKELRQYGRDRRVLALVVLLVGLSAAAVIQGRSAVRTLDRELRSAQQSDRHTWDNQGPKNPHTAAHFSRYAFRPTSSFAAFDPGLTPFVGRAVWLEAHHQNPAQLRPIDDAVEVQRFAALSPAWTLQYIAPLLVILLAFASIAQERQSGTLRQVMSTGLRPSTLFLGKSLAVLIALATFIPLVVLGALSAMSARDVWLPDSNLRLALLVGAYLVYLIGFTFAVIGVSARCRSSKTALVVLVSVWALCTTVVPRLSADVAAAVYPAPKSTDFWAQLYRDSSTAFWSKEAKPLRDKLRDDLLQEYGVQSTNELPINFDGYLLQASEEFANEVFDREYAHLTGLFEQQVHLARFFSVVSPTLAIKNLSTALCGTDLYAHHHFMAAAETFRRAFIKSLNQDMIDNAGPAGYGYLADDALWRRTPDPSYAAPSLAEVWSRIWLDAAILLVWMLLGCTFALWAVRSSVEQEASR